MNKYAFDIDDDDDDVGFTSNDVEVGRRNVSGPPQALTRTSGSAASTKAPAPLRYASNFDLTDASNPANPNSLDSLSVKKAFADRDLVTREENLGYSFYSSPWVPPDIDKAALYRMSNIYKEGRAPMDQINLTKDLSIGIGLNLYFQFAISLGIGLLVVSIFALPTLIISYAGEAVGPQDRDIIGLYALSIANIGSNPETLSYATDTTCTTSDSFIPTANQTCIQFYGSQYTMESVSLLVTGMEVLQIFAFFIMIWHLQARMKTIQFAHSDSGVPSITDYAVYVTNIPIDTTIEELINHFSDLYQLETIDFRGRLPVEDAAPVDSIGYSNNEAHVGSWVAECTICTKLGKVVNYLERRKELMKRLYEARARMKMYGPKTPHVKGFDPKKYLIEEKIMLTIAARVDKLNEKIHMSYDPSKEGNGNVATGGNQEDEESTHSRPVTPTSSKSMKGKKRKGARANAPSTTRPAAVDDDDSTNPFATPKATRLDRENSLSEKAPLSSSLIKGKSFKERINGLMTEEPALAAFVCFEYNESFARCLEDQQFWSSFPMRLCYPRKMLFKGRVLSITRAPEPDQIIWENIEIGYIHKFFARIRTIVYLLLLFILVYAVFAVAADVRAKYTDLTPPSGLCIRALPELYAGEQYGNDTILSRMQLTRPSNDQRELLDAQCSELIPDSYALRYTWDGDPEQSVANYSLSACTAGQSDIHALCPTNGQTSYCPCATHNAGGECSSMGCSSDDVEKCVKFSTADTMNCYCATIIDAMISSGGVGSILSWFFTSLIGSYPDASDECVDTKYYIGASTFALYIAIIITLVSNKLVKYIIMHNAHSERHVSFDALDRSVASRIFLGTYINMSIIILLAYGYSTESPAVLTDNYLFSGPYRDFDRGWYRIVGFYLVVTFLLMNFPHFLSTYYHYFFTLRFKKFAAYKEVMDLNGNRYPTQHSLNKIEADEKSFDVRVRTGQMLAWVCTAMTFGAGVPILLPLCGITLVLLFRMDKYLFSRYYKQPTPSGPGLIEWAIWVLPFIAMLRLAFSIFILSVDDLLPASWPSTAGANESAGGYSTSVISLESYISAMKWMRDQDYIPANLDWIERRILRDNTFPLLVLLVLIILVKIIRAVWDYLPPVVLIKYIARLCKVLCRFSQFRASQQKGYIHPYDLTFHNSDPLRNQEAALSGGYMKYLRHRDDKPFSLYRVLCCCMKYCFKEKEKLPDLGFRWEILEDGDFDVKIKTWPATMQLNDGSIKMTGDQKHTFDLISEQYVNSFNLEHIPRYSMVGLALRKEPFVPIIPAYLEWKEAFERENKLQNTKGIVPTEAPKKASMFSLGRSKVPADKEKGGKSEVVVFEEVPATEENKKKAVAKKSALAAAGGKKGKVVPTTEEGAIQKKEKGEGAAGGKSLKKAVSWSTKKVEVEGETPSQPVQKKKPAAAPVPTPTPGKKKVAPVQQDSSSSSSSSDSSSSDDLSSDSDSGSSSSSDGSGSSSSGSDSAD